MPRLAERKSTYAALLVLALAVRLAAAFWWQARLPEGMKFGFPDSESYWELGRAVARGGPYEFGADRAKVFRTPGYPLLLSGVFLALGNDPPVIWARALGAVIGTLAVGCVSLLAWQLFDARAALLAGCGAALLPDAVAMSTFILSEAPFCPLMVAQLLCWTLAARDTSSARKRLGWAFAGGLAAGAATLMRPSWLLFTPFALCFALLFYRDRWRNLAIGGVMLLGLAIAMCPWWVRNYHVAGRFVPTSLQVGASLYDGLHPGATGASDMRFVAEQRAAQLAEDAAATEPPRGLFEDRLDRRMQRESLAWARQNPGRVWQLVRIKFLRMWNVWPNAAELRSWPLRIVVTATYLPLLVLGLWGAGRYAPRGWPYLLCVLPAVYFTLLHVVFVSSIRYRQPALLLLIVLATGVAVEVFGPWLRGRQRGAAT
jgi:4-amino-4-deoxy-L-arabinose transferase-like glycosyltransferase